MNGNVKVKYTGSSYNRIFDREQIYEAQLCVDNAGVIIMLDKNGEEYGYPASEFQIMKE